MLERSPGSGLGLSLSGHKDRTKMAVMVCGLNPNGPAAKSGCLCVGDEILEVRISYFVIYIQDKLNDTLL